MGKKNIGSGFDNLLAEDAMLEEVTAVALKRVIAWQIAEEMKAQHLTKTELAKRMHTSRAALNRLLDEEDSSSVSYTHLDVYKRQLLKHCPPIQHPNPRRDRIMIKRRQLLPRLLADDAALLGLEEGRLFGPDWLRTIGALPNEYLYYFYCCLLYTSRCV